jgi:ELWxxDGT repeat protein
MELWVTNGTGRGTRLVRDICPGDCSSYPTDLISMKSRLLFRANDGLHSSQIWATDGTSPGTVILSDFDVYNESLHGAAAGSIFIFSAVESSHGREPWCTDGTSEGTYLLADLADEDLGGSHPGSLMAMGNTALFFADDGKHGYELWKSDGTAEGTDLVAELQAGASQTGRPEVPNWTSSAGRAFFFLEQTTGGLAGGNVKFPPPPKKFALWTSDGTAAGTYRLTSEGVLGISSVSPTRLPLTSLVFFSASDAEHGAEPWVTDGTTEGTHILADLEPGSASSFPSNFFVFQRKIWFMLSQGTTQRLWQSDGTAAGTVPLEASDLLWDKSLLVFHQQLWFRVRGDDGNGELWSTDGTTAGTRLRVALDFYPYEFFTDGDRLYLSGGGASWVSDGTPGGTLRFSGSTTTGVWVRCGSWLYYDSVEGLFVTDGTVAGTRALRPVNNETIERIHNLICLGHSVLALTEGRKLWQTNGTDAGTTMVGELLAEPDGTSVKLLQAGPRVFFPAWDPKTGWELWAAQE